MLKREQSRGAGIKPNVTCNLLPSSRGEGPLAQRESIEIILVSLCDLKLKSLFLKAKIHFSGRVNSPLFCEREDKGCFPAAAVVE